MATPDNTTLQQTQWNRQERDELLPDAAALQSPDVSLMSVDRAAQAAAPANLDLLDDLFSNPLEGLFE
jgi:hypothetical protein